MICDQWHNATRHGKHARIKNNLVAEGSAEAEDIRKKFDVLQEVSRDNSMIFSYISYF